MRRGILLAIAPFLFCIAPLAAAWSAPSLTPEARIVAFNPARKRVTESLPYSDPFQTADRAQISKLQPILQKIMRQTGANVVLDRHAILVGRDQFDITEPVTAQAGSGSALRDSAMAIITAGHKILFYDPRTLMPTSKPSLATPPVMTALYQMKQDYGADVIVDHAIILLSRRHHDRTAEALARMRGETVARDPLEPTIARLLVLNRDRLLTECQAGKSITAEVQAISARRGQDAARRALKSALERFMDAAEAIVKAIVVERGANIVVDSSAVIAAAYDIDITGAAAERLDRQDIHIPVVSEAD